MAGMLHLRARQELHHRLSSEGSRARDEHRQKGVCNYRKYMKLSKEYAVHRFPLGYRS